LRKSCFGVIILLIFFAFFATPSRCEENLPKETIRMAMFINYHPAYGSWLSKIVVLEFEGVEGLPIETNSPAFGEGFVEATILDVSYGMNGTAIRVVVEYDLSVNNETANNYASMISDEVMNAIGQSDLPVFWRNMRIDKATNRLIVTIDRGLKPRTYSFFKDFLKYRPKDGFASLVTEEFLEKSTSGQEASLSRARYILQKTSIDYQWNFDISFSFDEDLKDEDWVEILDLNSLLLNDGLIEPSGQRISEIIVEMPKYHKIPTGTYEMSIESIFPPQSVKEEDGWVRVTYQLTAPIDNVVATVKVSKLKPSFEWEKIIPVILVIAALAVIVILFLKKRKGGEKGR
jgi:hypothetical protein